MRILKWIASAVNLALLVLLSIQFFELGFPRNPDDVALFILVLFAPLLSLIVFWTGRFSEGDSLPILWLRRKRLEELRRIASLSRED